MIYITIMVDKKDEIILEALMHNARIGLKELSKLTHVTKSAVSYRIKKLEESKIIDKYDTIINLSKIRLYKEFLFLTIFEAKENEFLELIHTSKEIASCFKIINHEGYILVAFYKTKKQRTYFHKIIKRYCLGFRIFEIDKVLFKPYSIFNLNLEIRNEKTTDKTLRLDDTDIKLINALTNGNARKSILELSEELKIAYDLLNFRFKRLKKAGYFSLFMAQLSPKMFDIEGDFVLIKYKKNEIGGIIKKLNRIRQIFYYCELKDNVILTQVLTRDFKEFKNVLSELSNEIEEKAAIQIYLVEDTIFLNRFPFEWLKNY